MLTDDVPLTKFIRTMLSNRRFKVELNGKQSRWRNQRNGLFTIFNAIPSVVQYVHQRPATHSCHQQFHLSRRPVPYHPTPSPAAKRAERLLQGEPSVSKSRKDPANGVPSKELSPTATWMSPGTVRSLTILTHRFTLASRSLTYRNHCMKTHAKLSSRNNLLRKLHGTNWGCNWGTCPQTMRTTVTAICLSVVEYCCPVWARSAHRKLVDTTLNETCRLITGCIRATATPDLYVLSGIAQPEIRRSVHSQNERTEQLTDQRHSLHHQHPINSRVHTRNSFISTRSLSYVSRQKPVSPSGKNRGRQPTAI